LYEILKSKKIDNYSVWLKENSFEIEIQGVPPIYFDTARYELSPADQSRLRSLAPELYESVRGKPYYIHINGTADPRELRGRGIPPHNNIELSALRAATVAALLEEAAPGLGEYLRIVGLGVRGREVPLKPGDDPEEVYRPYRTVTLVIKVDMEKWLSVPPAGQEGPKP
jgi:flagellar motor protein MotB